MSEHLIRVVLADDHDAVIQGISENVDEQPDMRMVGTFKTGYGLVEEISALEPDVVLLDIVMPGLDVLEAIQALSRGKAVPKIIIVSASMDYYVATQGFRLGIAGYLLKEDSLSDDLGSKIRSVYRGGQAFSQGIMQGLQLVGAI